MELWRQLLWWWARVGASRGSRSRERIEMAWVRREWVWALGAGNWELDGQEMEVIAGSRFQLQLQVAGCRCTGWHISLAMARNALSTTGHRA